MATMLRAVLFTIGLLALATGGVAQTVAPTNLQLTAIGPSTAYLSWQDNSLDEYSFSIQRLDPGGVWTNVGLVGANLTTFGDSGLVPQTSYSYRVRAKGPSGNSSFTNTVTGTTTASDSPTAATGLTASAFSYDSVVLGWTDSSSTEDGFYVLRAGGGAPEQTIATLPPGSSSCRDSGLLAGTVYTYRIQAFNFLYPGTPSNSATATTWQTYIRSLVTGSDATVGPSTIQLTVTLSRQMAAATNVAISCATAGVTVPSTVTVAAGTSSKAFNCTISDLGSAPTSILVVAKLGLSVQAASIGWAQTSAVFQISDLAAQAGASAVFLSWTEVDPAVFGSHYPGTKVQRSLNGGAFSSISSPLPGVRNWVDRSVTSGNTYAYKLVTQDTHGVTLSTSNQVTVQPLAGSQSMTITTPPAALSGTYRIVAQGTSQGRVLAFVDKIPVASGGSGIFNRSNANEIAVNLNTQSLTNGTHTLYLGGVDATGGCSNQVTIDVENDVSTLAVEKIVSIGEGIVARVSGTLPAGTSTYAVRIKNRQGAVLRTIYGDAPRSRRRGTAGTIRALPFRTANTGLALPRHSTSHLRPTKITLGTNGYSSLTTRRNSWLS